MDDRRFDSLVKSFASGASRRSVLKGILGLGGAALGGGALLEQEAGAAARPTPTPKPVKCPGSQTWNGSACACPTGLERCGPDCCNSHGIPDTPSYSECCDNACCFGHCYGEELCCAYPLVFCEAQNECCGADQNQCCGSEGCCDHECCPVAGGAGACCEGENSKCCAGDACIPESGCCSDDECGGCQSCIDHVCTDDRSNCPNGVDGCYDCVSGSCQKNTAYCNDGNPCTGDVCSDDGFCSNPFHCSDDSCCSDGNRCTIDQCNGDGTCSNPFFCSDDDCCPGDEFCLNGSCYTPCDELGEECDDGSCCSGLHCYSLVPGEVAVCGPCIPDFTPCLTFCDFCCHTSIAGVCSPVAACAPEGIPCPFDDFCCSGSCTGIIPTCD